jgi:hypothetical protein
LERAPVAQERRYVPVRRSQSKYTPGSMRAEGRGESRDHGPLRWLAGDFKRGTFRTRREALAVCPPGVLPIRLVVRNSSRSPGERRP